MAIFQTTVASFKVELYQAVHNFGPTLPDTFKLALYTASATLDQNTTEYSTAGEVTDAGYTAGGAVLTITASPTWGLNSQGVPTAYLSFADAIFPAAITARAGLIYNSTKGNKAVAVLDFGADKQSRTAFSVIFPVADPNNAIVRIS